MVIDERERKQIHTIRTAQRSFKLRKVDKGVHRELEHGWLLPYVTALDSQVWNRWDYLFEIIETGALPEREIPRIEFGAPDSQTLKMLEQCLDEITGHGSWRGWGSSTYFDYFLDWLLFGLGDSRQPETPREPGGCEGASDRLYQVFQCGAMQFWPSDYFGHLMCETGFGKHAGFFPTPLPICEMMARMTFGNDGTDHRTETFNDPCVGTGRMPMCASNYVLTMTGIDIMATCVKATLVNLALYAPWGYKPVPFLDHRLKDFRPGGELAARMIELADLGEWQRVAVTGVELGRRVASQLDESCALSIFEPSEQLGAGTKGGLTVHHSELADSPSEYDRIVSCSSLWGDYGIASIQATFKRLRPGGVMTTLVHRNYALSSHPKYEEFDQFLKTCCTRFEQVSGPGHPLFLLCLERP